MCQSDFMTEASLVTYVTRSCLTAMEVVALVCTLARTYKTWREGRQVGIYLPITTFFLRDGMFRRFSMALNLNYC